MEDGYPGMKNLTSIFVLAAILLLSAASATGRANFGPDDSKGYGPARSTFAPAHCIAVHRIGALELSVSNNGTLGDGFRSAPGLDCFTGDGVVSCAYPKYSGSTYLFAGAFWIGAVVGRDTLVSVGADGWSPARELFPDPEPFGLMEKRSLVDPAHPMYENAISEEDFLAVYTDTVTEGVRADYFGRPHTPLHIEVSQNSYAWSYSYAEDFILFDYKIENIGGRTLQDVYMGVYVDGDVWHGGGGNTGAQDDMCGFLLSFPDSCGECEFADTVFAAWIADADGDMSPGAASDTKPVPHLTATRIVRTPQDSLDVSFNWWISDSPSRDFGPRHAKDYRDFRTGGYGTPEGDVNKYHVLSNREFDYDQVFSSRMAQGDSIWLPISTELADRVAVGEDTRYLLSFGPFEIDPGQTLPVSFAYIAGANLHNENYPNNHDNLPENPSAFYANLDFSDLARNSDWASAVYDNPGVDTDGDGYFGEFVTCPLETQVYQVDTTIDGRDTTITVTDTTLVETCWVTGDNIPDFRGASAPPAPDYWIQPTSGSLAIRFNGKRSETTLDPFSRVADFEGYRVYISRDKREASYTMVASYDRENFNKMTWNTKTGHWELLDIPFSRQRLLALYGSGGEFEPLAYTRSSPYIHPLYPDSQFYFEKEADNTSEFGVSTPIRKRYPDQPYPSTLVPEDADPSELTEDGYFKYFEYVVEISDLLPSVPWYVSVTAFDFGSPESDLGAIESSKTAQSDSSYALPAWSEVDSTDLKVSVYPNPYRLDGRYNQRGFEGRNPGIERPVNRTRLIHFINLPPRCTISIFTLDGDLVRRIEHDVPAESPNASHDTWSLISRNSQLVVSGLYYWTVESPGLKTQIGKLSIIM